MEEKRRYWEELQSKLAPLSPCDSFYTWFHSHLVFFLHFQQVLFPSPVTPSHPLFPPPPTIFHSVYLSTFTVTALESQESKLAPSLSFRRSRFMPLCPFPAFSITLVEIHINLCIGGMEGPRYSPSRQQALSFSSHAQPLGYPALIYSHTRGRTLELMSNINLLKR